MWPDFDKSIFSGFKSLKNIFSLGTLKILFFSKIFYNETGTILFLSTIESFLV